MPLRGESQQEGLLGWERDHHMGHISFDGLAGCASGHDPGNSGLELKNVVRPKDGDWVLAA